MGGLSSNWESWESLEVLTGRPTLAPMVRDCWRKSEDGCLSVQLGHWILIHNLRKKHWHQPPVKRSSSSSAGDPTCCES
ncbi:hypothetical protein AGIG_G10541 [Arapaima gigas]